MSQTEAIFSGHTAPRSSQFIVSGTFNGTSNVDENITPPAPITGGTITFIPDDDQNAPTLTVAVFPAATVEDDQSLLNAQSVAAAADGTDYLRYEIMASEATATNCPLVAPAVPYTVRVRSSNASSGGTFQVILALSH